ncbi:MAG: CRISPR-associated endonuclease Cas2 [Clostridia bacterium]
MLILITYDVNTTDAKGRSRLRKIAKECVNYGQRVQNSVFECSLDTTQYRQVQHRLCSIMDKDKDSIRFYFLGKRPKIEHFGVKESYDPDSFIMI